MGILSTQDLDEDSLLRKVRTAQGLVGANLVAEVSEPETRTFDSLPPSHSFAAADAAPVQWKVVAYDCGVKDSILRNLTRIGCEVTCVGWDTPAEEVLALDPDGVFLSNGPGDPQAVDATFREAEKLKFGHRGGNHPVMNLLAGRVEITAQNHGFGIRFSSLGEIIPELSGGRTAHEEDLRAWAQASIAPVVCNDRFGRIRLTHVNLNDGTLEGMEFLDIPAFCVQYHPEASPGPTDSHYLFTAFGRLMSSVDGYLDIDIARDRLHGWKFGGGRVA